LSGRGLCDELITRPEESYRLCCVVVCDLETSRIGAPCIYDISSLRVNYCQHFDLVKLVVTSTLYEAKQIRIKAESFCLFVVENSLRNTVRGPPLLLQIQVVSSCMDRMGVGVGFVFIEKYRDIILCDISRHFSLRPFHVTADSARLAAVLFCP